MNQSYTKPARVLFLFPRMPVGGAETFITSLLHRMDKKVIQPIVFSMGCESDPMFLKIPNEVPRYIHARKWRYDLSPCTSIENIIVDDQIQTVVCTDYFTYFYFRYALRRRKFNVRVVILLQVTKPRSMKEYLHGFIFARMLRASDEIQTICKNQKQYLARLFKIPDDRFAKTIYNGVDTVFWSLPVDSELRNNQRAKYGIPEHATVILNVAGFRPEKRHDLLLQAFAKIQQTNSRGNYYLLLVGGGNATLRAKIETLAKKLDIADRVVFAGIQENVRPMYWASDIFTLASTSETFSIAALEAMASGLPCVLTKIGGADEMIDENINGLLVEAGSSDALADGWARCAAMLDSFDRAEIRKKVVERFTLNECVQNYERYFSEENRN
jgi:glycosyltransferase involved in cell wall biosynthesis